MPQKKLALKTTDQHRNLRLDQVLAEWLPIALGQPVSKGKVRKLIVAGAVYLNKKRVRIASKVLLSNATVEVYLDLGRLNSTERDKDIQFVMSSERVLFEDDDIIVVNKPPGLPTQPTVDEARDNLFLSVKKFLAQRAKCSVSEIYLGLHHRLDRDTSGVILFTKTQRANPGIAEIFSSHTAVKTYQALAAVPHERKSNSLKSSQIPASWTVKNYLGRTQTSGKKAKYGSVRSGGDFAHTDFRLIRHLEGAIWVEARLHTGRTHQIRVHLSEGGTSILGDVFYGGPLELNRVRIPRLMLHAADLTFPHPIHQNTVSVHCSLPGDFSQCIKKLEGGEVDS